MIDKRKIDLFIELLNNSNSILIVCSQDSSQDQLLSLASLYAALKLDSKKSVKLLCGKEVLDKNKEIAYLKESLVEIGHENLCISLDYQENSIDKVSYHVSDETKKFYLTIKPKKGFPPLSDQNVEFSYTGAQADLIILVDTNELDSLGEFYFGYENLYNQAAIVSINKYETEFGNIKFDASELSCYCEFVFQLISELDLFVSSESATNLLRGITQETNNFSSFSTTADTFEVVSKLMRAGARRISGNKNKGQFNNQQESLKIQTNSQQSTKSNLEKSGTGNFAGSFSPKNIKNSKFKNKKNKRK